MIIKRQDEVPREDMSAFEGIEKQVLIGPGDGSSEVAVRLFSIKEGASTPYHPHGFPHLVKVERGAGCIVDAGGAEHPLVPGHVVYVPDEELHCFKNTGAKPFDILCIVPARGEKKWVPEDKCSG